MYSLNIDNHWKALAFKKFKCFLYKYYSRFSKINKIVEHLNKFCCVLYDCRPSLSQFLSINKLLKSDNEWIKIQLLLYIEKSQNTFLFLTKKTKKHIKIKRPHAPKAWWWWSHAPNNDIFNSFNSELQLKKYWICNQK